MHTHTFRKYFFLLINTILFATFISPAQASRHSSTLGAAGAGGGVRRVSRPTSKKLIRLDAFLDIANGQRLLNEKQVVKYRDAGVTLLTAKNEARKAERYRSLELEMSDVRLRDSSKVRKNKVYYRGLVGKYIVLRDTLKSSVSGKASQTAKRVSLLTDEDFTPPVIKLENPVFDGHPELTKAYADYIGHIRAGIQADMEDIVAFYQAVKKERQRINKIGETEKDTLKKAKEEYEVIFRSTVKQAREALAKEKVAITIQKHHRGKLGRKKATLLKARAKKTASE